MKYIYLLLFFILFQNPLNLYAKGIIDNLFGNNKNTNEILLDSNTAVSITADGKDCYYVIYKNENDLFIDIILHSEEEKAEYNRKSIKISNIKIYNEYFIEVLEKIIIIYANNILYRVNLPQINTNTVNAATISDNVKDALIYENLCFYITDKNEIYIYEPSNNKSTKYSFSKLPDFNSFAVVKSEYYKLMAEANAERWFNDFCISLLDDVDLDITDENKIKLQRYLQIKYADIMPGSGYKYRNLDSFIREDLEKARKEANISLQEKNFIEKWGVAPNGNLFNSGINFPQNQRIQNAAPIVLDIYNGLNPQIIYLINYYNSLISIYKDLERNTERDEIIISGFNTFIKEFNNIIAEEERLFKNNIEDYNKSANDNLNNFKNAVIDKAKSNMISFESNNYFQPFDFVYLAYNQSKFVLIFKNIEDNDELNNFRRIGQNARKIGINNEFIYTCEDETLKLFDPFYFTEQNISKTNEKILFSVNQNKNIFITKSMNNNYNLKEIKMNNKSINIGSASNVINNLNNRTQSNKMPFFSAILGNYIYLNFVKSKTEEKIKENNDYIYIENPTGSGIIIQRSVK